MNAWFPRLRGDGVIASGNAGIWLTPLTGDPVQVSPVGIGPIWSGQTLVFNRNDGTTQVGGLDPRSPWRTPLAIAYTDYVGSDSGQWAGMLPGVGTVQRFTNILPTGSAQTGCCAPRFYGPSFGYLAPYQTAPDNRRTLFIDGQPRATNVIIDWQGNRDGNGYVYVVATGPYTKALYDHRGNNITIRAQQDEVPITPLFTGPDDYPWMVSGTPVGTFVRMIYSASGYVIPGDLFFPDARIIGGRLRVVGSLANGAPTFNNWIDFAAPRVDLRKV